MKSVIKSIEDLYKSEYFSDENVEVDRKLNFLYVRVYKYSEVYESIFAVDRDTIFIKEIQVPNDLCKIEIVKSIIEKFGMKYDIVATVHGDTCYLNSLKELNFSLNRNEEDDLYLETHPEYIRKRV